MANPRQRRKARSGARGAKPTPNALRRLHNREKRAPTMQGPKILQEGWDKRKTVFQNYEALGLLPSLALPKPLASSSKLKSTHPSHNHTTEESSDLPVISGYGKIIRDEEGNVIDIVLEEGEGGDGGVVAGGDDEDEEEARVEHVEAKTEIVKNLESLSSLSRPVKRHTSTSEHAWLLQLVGKYGDDVDKMSRDRKGNVWQKTAGELRRMLKKAGGVDKLRKELEAEGGAMDLTE